VCIRAEVRNHDERDDGRLDDGEDRQQRSRRLNPDAPGNHVDDSTCADVPEPNEPGRL
jgi:hypothetical protein